MSDEIISSLAINHNQHSNVMLQEYLTTLPNNRLAETLKERVDLFNGKLLANASRKRKIILIVIFLVGIVVSSIGSLTFLVGKEFPKEFANFVKIEINDNIADAFGNVLGWTNVTLEAIFYTWIIMGIVPEWTLNLCQKRKQEDLIHKMGRCKNRIVSYLPAIGKLALSILASIPLAFLSLIDEEKSFDHSDSLKYTIVFSISLVNTIGSYSFLTIAGKQFKSVWNWLRRKEECVFPENADLLSDIKSAFLKATLNACEGLEHLSKSEFENLILSLKSLTRRSVTLELQTLQSDYQNLLAIIMFQYSFVSKALSKTAVALILTMAVLVGFCWVGLIAVVPDGIEQKLTSSKIVQYLFAVITAIPLTAISVSIGGSLGLKLSRIRSSSHTLTANLTNSKIRKFGYFIVSFCSLFSFGTNGAVVVQQFQSNPVIVWLLFPSATLGMVLMNAFASADLLDQILSEISAMTDKDKKLFVEYKNYLTLFSLKIDEFSSEEITAVLLTSTPTVQDKMKQTIPTMKDVALSEFVKNATEKLNLQLIENHHQQQCDLELAQANRESATN